MAESLAGLFSLEGQVAVVTGATGVLGGAMARGLALAGARVGIMGRRADVAQAVADDIIARGGEAMALPANVLQKAELEAAREAILERWGSVDILVNAAGGNVARATLTPDQSIFELPEDAFREVFDLNLLGTLLPSQVFGEAMTNRASGPPRGSIINISSVVTQRAITRVVGYAAAKSAVDNFTRWLASELARKYGAGLRVNAITPGFFIGDQNRKLLINDDGSLTQRGQTIIDHTPAGRFGEADELVSTLIWLCGPGASFVNGVIVQVDGGFNAFSGV